MTENDIYGRATTLYNIKTLYYNLNIIYYVQQNTKINQ